LQKKKQFSAMSEFPASLESYYEELLERTHLGDIPLKLTSIVSLLGWAKEPMTNDMLERLLVTMMHQIDVGAHLSAIGTYLQAVQVLLHRARDREGCMGWTLYHESFRKFLHESPTVRDVIGEAQRTILNWCSKWGDHGHP